MGLQTKDFKKLSMLMHCKIEPKMIIAVRKTKILRLCLQMAHVLRASTTESTYKIIRMKIEVPRTLSGDVR